MSGAVALSSRVRFIVVALAAGAALIGLVLVFLALAGYLALLHLLPPWEAALAVAGGSLVIAGILLALAFRTIGRASEQVQLAVKSNAVAVAAPMALRLLARNARLAASVAALAGTALTLLRVVRRREQSS